MRKSTRTNWLKHEATRIAESMGHKLGPFEQLSDTVATTKCIWCNGEVTLNREPGPTELQLMGMPVNGWCPTVLGGLFTKG